MEQVEGSKGNKPESHQVVSNIRIDSNAWLIKNFGKFIFGFWRLKLRDFLYDSFRLQGKTGKTFKKCK